MVSEAPAGPDGQTAARPAAAHTAPPHGALRSLRTELLFNLAFLTSAAVVLASLTTLLVATLDPDAAVWTLWILWAASTLLFVLFGRHLVQRLVLRPLSELSAEADRLANGELSAPGRPFETRELAHLAERFHSMAEQLLDVQSQAVRAEKLAGVGRLAAGVAHEIRNPLGAFGTYVEVLRRRGADAALVDGMRREVARMDRIVEGLLDYARPGTPSGRAWSAARHAPAGALRARSLQASPCSSPSFQVPRSPASLRAARPSPRVRLGSAKGTARESQ